MVVVGRARLGVGARAIAGLASLASAGTVAAQGGFHAPETCGTQAEFSRELERLLGAEGPRATPQSVTIDGSDGADYRLLIVLREGTRELRHTDCRTLFRSAVVIAAASYQEERRRQASPAEPPAPASPRAPPSAPPEPSSPSIRFFLGGGIGAAAGPLPAVSPLFELAFGAEREKLGLSLALRYFVGTEAREPSGHGVLVNGFGARLMVAYEPWRPLRASAGVGVYRLSGEGRGTFEPLSDETVAVEPALELMALPVRTDAFELGIAVGAHWAAVQPSFVIGGYGEVFEVPRFGGEGLFRAIWRIP
ncbi:MAG TPA: hypothetical protein VFZ53_01695 [Polyangiaceae bacterium]